MSLEHIEGFEDLSLESVRRINRVCRQFEATLKAGGSPRVEDYLGRVDESERSVLCSELLKLQRHYRPNLSYYLGSTLAIPAERPRMAASDDDGRMVPRGPSPHAPEDLNGRYRLLKMLGEGAFGAVYLARDDRLDRKVAIKLPKRARIADESEVRAYLAEARTLARLDHPHILSAYDCGRADDGRCYLVSKYIEGGALSARLRRGRVYPPEAAKLVLQIASALEHAHSQGLVHRDIKPDNLLIDSAGHALIADFGLALNAADWGPNPLIAGTLPYMSPEQASGEVQLLDGRSDLFSLGIVFYELLAGRRPFEGQTPSELLDRIRDAEPLPPELLRAGIPSALGDICMKCLEKRPEDRFQTAGELVEALETWLEAREKSPLPNSPHTSTAAASGSWLRTVALIASILFAASIWSSGGSSVAPMPPADGGNAPPGAVNRNDRSLSLGWPVFDQADVEAMFKREAYQSLGRRINSIPFGPRDPSSPVEGIFPDPFDPGGLHSRGPLPFDSGRGVMGVWSRLEPLGQPGYWAMSGHGADPRRRLVPFDINDIQARFGQAGPRPIGSGTSLGW